MALSFAVLGIKVSKDRQKKMTGISHRLEGCTGQKVAAKRPTLNPEKVPATGNHGALSLLGTVPRFHYPTKKSPERT